MTLVDEAGARISEARRRGDQVSIVASTAATVIVITPAPSVGSGAEELLPLATAAQVAATSVRVLRDAIRAKDLRAYGNQRDRSVRRADLEKWIEGRAAKPHAAIDDADMDRRIKRLAAARARGAGDAV